MCCANRRSREASDETRAVPRPQDRAATRGAAGAAPALGVRKPGASAQSAILSAPEPGCADVVAVDPFRHAADRYAGEPGAGAVRLRARRGTGGGAGHGDGVVATVAQRAATHACRPVSDPAHRYPAARPCPLRPWREQQAVHGCFQRLLLAVAGDGRGRAAYRPRLAGRGALGARFALIVIVGTEFVAARNGLGARIWLAYQVLDMQTLYAGLVTTVLLGWTLDALLSLATRLAIPWAAG